MSNQNGYYPKSVQPGIPQLSETPKGWQKEPLEKHLIEIKRPAEMVNDKQYQLITVKRSRGGVEERAKLFGKDIKVKSQFYVQTGDFLISKRQIVHGACGLVPNELNGALVSGEYSVLGTNGGMSLAYLKYLSESVYFQQTCFQSSIGVHVEKMVFKIDRWLKWDFNIPPLPEQKKIADILTTVDDKISSIDSQIKQTEQLKKGLMEKLLTEGIGHTEFKETEIGRIPKDWGCISTEDFLQTKKGAMKIGPFGSQLKKSFFVQKGYKVYGQENVYLNDFTIGERYIDSDRFEALKTCMIESGDFLISMMGTVGKCSVVPDGIEPGIMDSHLIRLQIDDQIYSKMLLSQIFLSELVLKQIRRLSVGGIMEGLSSSIIKSLLFPLPPLQEQKQIATILSTVDDKLDILTQKKSNYQTLKKGLSQQLLTGQMRVKV